MSDMQSLHDDEIDLFELVETLWNGKWLLAIFTTIPVLLSLVFVVFQTPVYESKIIYNVDSLPPFYEGKKASADFQRMFFSKKVFETWKKKNDNLSIIYTDLARTELVDGFIISKDDDSRLAMLISEKKLGTYILVKTGSLNTLNDFYIYAAHINDLLTSDYVMRAQDELNIIEARFEDISNSSETIIGNLLAIDRFIVAANKGAQVLSLERPTRPAKTSPKIALTLVLSALVGGMVGGVFVLGSNVICKRKELVSAG